MQGAEVVNHENDATRHRHVTTQARSGRPERASNHRRHHSRAHAGCRCSNVVVAKHFQSHIGGAADLLIMNG